MPNIKTVQHQYLQARFLLDIIMIAVGMWFAYFFRFTILDLTGILPVDKNYYPRDYYYLFGFSFPLLVIIFAANGLYGLRDPVINLKLFKDIFRATFIGFAVVISVLYFFREAERFSRPVLLISPFFIIGFVTVSRLLLRRKVERRLVEKQVGVIGVLIVGINKSSELLIRKIRENPQTGLDIRGVITVKESVDEEEFQGVEILGGIKQIRNLIQLKKVRQVIFAQPDLSNQEIFDLMIECEKEMVESRFVPNLLESHLTDCSFENIAGLPLFGLKQTPLVGLNLVLKQIFDKVVSSLILVLGSPLYLGLAIWVLIDDGFPILYKQRRLGMDGRSFNMYKFRSMKRDAERAGKVEWTTEDDPRKTFSGAIMRKWNLDELPQLVNVWRGDMSLVGPRPERPEWVEKFREEFPRYMVRHTVKSGMTGWAQVSGLRGDSDLKKRLEADLYYIENWTLWLDIKILIMTIWSNKNAY